MSDKQNTPAVTAQQVAESLDSLRENTPLVQCLTNSVVTGFTANVLLSLGAAAAMVDIPVEAGAFAGIASGVLVNVGTPHAEQREAMIEAATAASDAGTPWVLDPVAVGALPVRTALARELLALRPTVIRGNASEIIGLADFGTGGRGVDSTDSPEGALGAAQHLAAVSGAVIAISGPVDLITDGTTVVRVANGHPYLTLVTGGGCALGAVTAAFLSQSVTPLTGAVAATTAYTIASELAFERSAGPGTFAASFLDELHGLSADIVIERAHLS